MSVNRIYKNLYGESITQTQAQKNNNFYSEEIYEDSILKKTFRYSGNELMDILIYLDSSDNIQDAINELNIDNGGGGIYFGKQVINGYTCWEYEHFRGLEKIAKCKYVFDQSQREVAFQVIDITTGNILDVSKKFYLEDLGVFASHVKIPENGIFKFYYDFSGLEIGEIFVDLNLSYYMDVGGGGFTIDSDQNIFLEDSELASVFNWNEHPYYHSAEPLVPVTPVL